jgi:hypothetical protein
VEEEYVLNGRKWLRVNLGEGELLVEEIYTEGRT